jgi:hypothetical protein
MYNITHGGDVWRHRENDAGITASEVKKFSDVTGMCTQPLNIHAITKRSFQWRRCISKLFMCTS